MPKTRLNQRGVESELFPLNLAACKAYQATMYINSRLHCRSIEQAGLCCSNIVGPLNR